jgi:hypothetical protein
MRIVFVIVLSIFTALSRGQEIRNANDSLLIGTWKGTSICQVRPSPCNDEIAVYHITRGAKPNTYHMVMNKVINEKEEEMGLLDYNFDVAKQTLSSSDREHGTVWNFHVTDNRMEGTLVFQNKIYRIIKLSKSANN